MPKRSRKPAGRDFNQIARSVVDKATGVVTEVVKGAALVGASNREKDPAAVALGRKGGLKGGKARAAKLTKAQLSASGKKAAKARWANRTGS